MIQIAAIIIVMIWLGIETVNYYKGEFTMTTIKGLMIGALYHNESNFCNFNNNDNEELITEHTVQLLFFIFSFNFFWITED
jgi:hypothetical protein